MFYDKLKNAAARDALRLHTPGHKGALCELDLTELTDGSFPSDGLETAEKRAAFVYGARHCRYLCCGSSQGVKAAAYHICGSAIIDVNSHRSVEDGLYLGGNDRILAGVRRGLRPLTLKQIQSALDVGADKKPAAVILTSPTYYGFVADVAGIAEFCRKRGLLLITDAAHGAHFGFSEFLPPSPVPVSDICNVSAHKTLCSLTQTAMLFDNLADERSDELGLVVDLMGTTSPSYLLYASIERGVEQIASDAARTALKELSVAVGDLKREFGCFIQNDDFTRLVLDTHALGTAAEKLNAALAARGVFSEKCDDRHIVFLLTAADTPDTVERFAKELRASIREI